jgi:hypothetical protein
MIACLGTEFGAIRAASPCALDQVGKNRTVMNMPPRNPDHGRTVSETQAPGPPGMDRCHVAPVTSWGSLSPALKIGVALARVASVAYFTKCCPHGSSGERPWRR